jgi:hypothetical protein
LFRDCRTYREALTGIVADFRVYAVEKPWPGSTGFWGVSRKKGRAKYQAMLKVKGRTVFIGSYDTAEEAALAYDEAAKKLFGPRARLNFG